MSYDNDQDDIIYIFRPWRTNPVTKEREYAKDFGFRAWRIPVKRSNYRSP